MPSLLCALIVPPPAHPAAASALWQRTASPHRRPNSTPNNPLSPASAASPLLPRRNAAAAQGTSADWPAPLTPQERLARSARFWSVVGPVVLAYQWQQLKFNIAPGMSEAERDAEWTKLHEWGERARARALHPTLSLHLASIPLTVST